MTIRVQGCIACQRYCRGGAPTEDDFVKSLFSGRSRSFDPLAKRGQLKFGLVVYLTRWHDIRKEVS
jgi:hypothetical protein